MHAQKIYEQKIHVQKTHFQKYTNFSLNWTISLEIICLQFFTQFLGC